MNVDGCIPSSVPAFVIFVRHPDFATDPGHGEDELTATATFPKVRPSAQEREGRGHGLAFDRSAGADLPVPGRPPGGDDDLGAAGVSAAAGRDRLRHPVHHAAGALAVLDDVRARPGT